MPREIDSKALDVRLLGRFSGSAVPERHQNGENDDPPATTFRMSRSPKNDVDGPPKT